MIYEMIMINQAIFIASIIWFNHVKITSNNKIYYLSYKLTLMKYIKYIKYILHLYT